MEENSDITRRFTDLFADIFHEGGADMRPQIVQAGGRFYEDRLVHRTAHGELVRSKSEAIIADALYYHHWEYVYKPELVLDDIVKRPDFKNAGTIKEHFIKNMVSKRAKTSSSHLMRMVRWTRKKLSESLKKRSIYQQ